MEDRQTVEGGFGVEHFGAANLGDVRRTRRLTQIADRIVKHPGGTPPDKINEPADLKAFYRLMNNPNVTHESVLTPSRERTLRLMGEGPGTVLVIHDTTELDYSGLSIPELGQIGNGSRRGYLVHNALAVVAETREVMGLAYQKLAKRPKVVKKETRRERRERPDRESRLWKQASKSIPAPAPGRRQIEVADRGADVLEFLDFVESQGKSYLVRSKHNRCISLENREKTKLHDFARALPSAGQKTVEVQGTAKQPARRATVSIAWAEVTLLVPLQPRGKIRGLPLRTWVICVSEIDPPAGVAKPLEWILLTNVPVRTLEDALERIVWYECRWIVEEYHKAMKTGVEVESLQFTSEGALQPAIALLSVGALFLLNLRNASRHADAKERRAAELLPELFVTVLALWRYKQARLDLSVHEFYYALARLGGHQNRRRDHPPGWLVLWRGWTKLQSMVDIMAAYKQQKCG